MAVTHQQTTEEVLTWIQSRLKAPKKRLNQFGNYSYRNCEDILEAAKPLLAECGATLLINDDLVSEGGRLFVMATATLMYKGRSLCVNAYAEMPPARKGMDIAQSTGSTSSYARKYALNGLFLIDDNQDPDTEVHHQQVKESMEKEIKSTDDMVQEIYRCKNINDLDYLVADITEEAQSLPENQRQRLRYAVGEQREKLA